MTDDTLPRLIDLSPIKERLESWGVPSFIFTKPAILVMALLFGFAIAPLFDRWEAYYKSNPQLQEYVRLVSPFSRRASSGNISRGNNDHIAGTTTQDHPQQGPAAPGAATGGAMTAAPAAATETPVVAAASKQQKQQPKLKGRRSKTTKKA